MKLYGILLYFHLLALGAAYIFPTGKLSPKYPEMSIHRCYKTNFLGSCLSRMFLLGLSKIIKYISIRSLIIKFIYVIGVF